MEPILIGLGGVAESGKDTTFELIEQWCLTHGYSAVREAFADRLKISAAHALGVFDNEVDFCNDLKEDRSRIDIRMVTPGEGPNTLVHNLKGREFLQYYGTEAHREVFGTDFWIDAVLPLGSETPNGPFAWWNNFRYDLGKSGGVADFCVITDVRFLNEAERIKDLGGQVWRLERNTGASDEHVSEQELPGNMIDIVIDNNGTMKELWHGVEILMKALTREVPDEQMGL